MKLLIIKNDGLGDLILASGIITHLSKYFSESLDLLTCQSNEEIAKSIKGINNIYYTSRDSIKQYSILNTNRIKIPFRIAKDKCNIVRFSLKEKVVIEKINEINYDLVIVLRRYIRQSSLHILSQIKSKKKLVMWEYPTNLSFSHAKMLNKQALHLSTINLNKFIRPELEYYEAILSNFFKKEIFANPTLSFKINNTIKEKNSVGIIISGSSITLSTKQIIILCKYFVNKKYKVHLLGGKDDIKKATLVQKEFKNIINHVGFYKFIDYPDILSPLSLIIGNDTGLTHFSSLYNNKVIVILGGGTFKSFFPWRENKPQKIISQYLDCYYCLWNCTSLEKNKCINILFDKENIFTQLDKYT